MGRVVHFEIPANDPETVISFYHNVFDWKITKWESDSPVEYWLCDTGDKDSMGINGAIFKPKETMNTMVNIMGVGNLQESLDKVTANGGKVVTEIMEIPNIGKMAYCVDTEGTLFGVIEPVMPG